MQEEMVAVTVLMTLLDGRYSPKEARGNVATECRVQ